MSLAVQLLSVSVMGFGSFPEPVSKVIDSAVHVWSDGNPPFSWAKAPSEELQTAATHEALAHLAREAGVAGALIVQPSVHMFDHSYVTAALRANPGLYRGMCLANPTLEPAAAAAELARLHADGFAGVPTWSKCPLGSAPARPLCLLRACLAALESSVLPERGPFTARPATASGAHASRLQSRRFHRL